MRNITTKNQMNSVLVNNVRLPAILDTIKLFWRVGRNKKALCLVNMVVKWKILIFECAGRQAFSVS